MPSATSAAASRPPLTLFAARRIHTMDESLPEATWVAVSEGRIVAVGSREDMAPWCTGREVTVNESLQSKVLLPGLIDNHIHPFLGAILLPMELIAPEPWRMPSGDLAPAARTPHDYRARLMERIEARPDVDEWFISWGDQPALHGRYDRAVLDELFGARPVVLWQRSFHETFLNSAAIAKLGLSQAQCEAHPQIDWATGHFFETGNKLVVAGLMPHLLRPQWYHEGLKRMTALMHMGGMTTAGDMLFGSINPDYEVAALQAVLEEGNAPLRVVNVFDSRGFSNRAMGIKVMCTPAQSIGFEAGLKAMAPWLERNTRKLWFGKAVKLFADGAMFTQLMQMKAPGYIDGHHGEWLMAPAVLKEGVRTFWAAGYTVHVHVNGDAGMEAVIDALSAAQEDKPRFDHRFHAHHVGFHTQAQTARLAALGAHASVNPYYIHALADDYSRFGLGPERAAQITRCASMRREGMRVSFHSDFMMAPPEPLTLAWCAANRITHTGRVVSPSERLTLMQALRGITIDAAWALRVEDEVGSIVAGKRADFCMLEDDPFELGVEQLHLVRVAGTVFEGELHLLPRPVASTFSRQEEHASAAVGLGAGGAVRSPERPVYRTVNTACCGATDRCDIVRQWAAWFGAAMLRPRPTS